MSDESQSTRLNTWDNHSLYKQPLKPCNKKNRWNRLSFLHVMKVRTGFKQTRQIGLELLDGPTNRGVSSNITSPGWMSLVATSVLCNQKYSHLLYVLHIVLCQNIHLPLELSVTIRNGWHWLEVLWSLACILHDETVMQSEQSSADSWLQMKQKLAAISHKTIVVRKSLRKCNSWWAWQRARQHQVF